MRVLGERDRLADSDAYTLRERGPARVAGQSYLAGLEGWVRTLVPLKTARDVPSLLFPRPLQ
jgi:hypothetical protein